MATDTPTLAPAANEETRTTSSEIPVRPFYRPADTADLPYDE
jgi:hypothetical protein